MEANSEERDPELEVIGLEVEQPPVAGIVATSEAMVAAVSSRQKERPDGARHARRKTKRVAQSSR